MVTRTWIAMMLLLCPMLGAAQTTRPVPYTLEDRDRLVRLEAETGLVKDEIRKLELEQKQGFASVRTELKQEIRELGDDLRNLMYTLFGLTSAMILALASFVVYDRRAAMIASVRPFELRLADMQVMIDSLRAEIAELKRHQQG